MTNLLEFNDPNTMEMENFTAYAICVQVNDINNKYQKRLREEVDKIQNEFATGTQSELFVTKLNKVQFWNSCNSFICSYSYKLYRNR